MHSHAMSVTLVGQEELMSQLAGQSVQVVHHHGLHPAGADQLPERGELRTVQTGPV